MFWSHFDWKIRAYHRYWRESKDEIFALRTLVVSAAVTKVGCLRNEARKYSVDPDRALCPLPPHIIWAMGAKRKCHTVTNGPIAQENASHAFYRPQLASVLDFPCRMASSYVCASIHLFVKNASTVISMFPPLRGHDGLDGPIYSVAFSPDGSKIISGSDDETIRVWDASTGISTDPDMNSHSSTLHRLPHIPTVTS